MKSITVFSQGEASSSKTWSNIPYYLVESLKQKGFVVNTVNVEINGVGRFVYDKIICRFLRHTFFRNTTFTYDRTSHFQKAVSKIMKSSVVSYPDTDLFISTSFSFLPSKYTDKPCVLLCDWTYEYLIRHFKGREPDCFEKKGISIQDEVINNSNYVFSLFPDVAKHMSKYYSAKIMYLGNVINSLPFTINYAEVGARRHNPHIVFVGLPKYIEGLKSLLKAVEILQIEYNSINLDVIGMTPNDVEVERPRHVTFHGYLEKSDDAQFEKYSSILKNAFVFVNTTPHWAGFSSTLEAMYYGLPIYTSRYNSFIETFGKELDFGKYCENNSPQEIADYLKCLIKMSQEDYLALCVNARKKADPYTWSAYVDKMLNTISL